MIASARCTQHISEFEVFCECGRGSCRDGIKEGLLVARDVYEKVRRLPTHFLIKHSHAEPAERVVDSHENFLIVGRVRPSGLAAIPDRAAKNHEAQVARDAS